MLQVAQQRTWLKSELGGEYLAGPAIGGKGVGGAAGSIQGEHQLTPRPLSERMAIEQRLEVDDALLAGAARQLGLDRVLHHGSRSSSSRCTSPAGRAESATSS